MFIQCRVDAATKAALRTLAKRQEVTESALLKRTVDLILQAAGPAEVDLPAAVARPALVRLYVRLSSVDLGLLRERATTRRLAPATYASKLIRAHLRTLTPLPTEELQALRLTMMELRAIGANLNQIAQAANRGAPINGPSHEHLRAMLKVCEGLRNHVRELVRANTASWQSGYVAANS